MKKIFKNRLFCFLLGAILFSSVAVYATSTLLSKNVTFTPENSDWNVSNVEDALNDLYENSNNSVVTFDNIYTNHKFGTIVDSVSLSLDLEAGNYICESNASVAYTGPDASETLVSSDWDVITISGAENYNTIDYKIYSNSGASKATDLSSSSNGYLITYDATEIFTCSGDESFSITQTADFGWTNSSCPIIMNIKCVAIN